MNDSKLFIALPTTHGLMPVQFMTGIMDFAVVRPSNAEVHQVQNPYPNIARNTAAYHFLNSDCDYMLQIDADILFTAKQVNRMMEHDVDIVGGLYSKKKQGKVEVVAVRLPHEPPIQANGLVELMRIGTGFLMVKRCVFERMIEEYGSKIVYGNWEGGIHWDFFPMGIKNGEYVTEDWGFCDNARECGFKVYGDTKVQLGHIGSVIYPLESQVKEHNVNQ